MPCDVFRVSQTYVKKLWKSNPQNMEGVIKRREILLSLLEEDYSYGKNGIKKIMEAMLQNGITVKVAVIRRDIAMYRSVFRYFHGESIDVYDQKNMQRLAPLRDMIQDGFTSWEQIMNACKNDLHDGKGEQEKSAHTQSEKMSHSSSPEFSVQAEDMSKCILHTVDVLRDAAENFVAYHQGLVRREDELKGVISLSVVLRDQVNEQKKLIMEFQKETEALKELLAQTKKNNEDLQLQVKNLEKKVRERDVQIEDIKVASRLLLDACGMQEVQQPLEDVADEAVDEVRVRKLQLPELCTHYEKPFQYGKKFEKAFCALSQQYRNTVIKALELFSQHGPEYPGLHTCKHASVNPKSQIKTGEMKSRAGRQYRFTWTVMEAVVIHDLLHKNEII